MNLAVVGPLPPMRSGVADYSAALLPYLRRYFPKIVAVTESGLEADLPEGVVTAIYSRHDTIWRRGDIHFRCTRWGVIWNTTGMCMTYSRLIPVSSICMMVTCCLLPCLDTGARRPGRLCA